MKNYEVARVLFQIADLLEIQQVAFKPQAYRKAAMTIESLSEEIADIYKQGKLLEIPAIGEGIGKKITELLETGKLHYLGELKKQLPVNVEELMKIPGLGPKKIMLLYNKRGIKSRAELKNAILQRRLDTLAGFQQKTIQNILKGIETVEQRPTDRILLGAAVPIAEDIIAQLKKATGVSQIVAAGSLRRGKETVGDIDILATVEENRIDNGGIENKNAKIIHEFVAVKDVKSVTAQGATRAAIRLNNGLAVDLRVVQQHEFGSALLYFTGSKEHNISLRKIAFKKGYTLNEYGLFALKNKKDKKKAQPIAAKAAKTEQEIYSTLGMQYIPPELRENNGEIVTALNKKIPKLVQFADVKGDLQTQTTWSDGSNSIQQMAEQAKKLNLKYFAVTDHASQMGITNPLNEKRLAQQAREIEKVEKAVGICIFKGAEIDIKKDGTLALPKNVVRQLDFRLVSVHTATKMTAEEMTKRICSALENYPCSSLAHPTGRLLLEREPYEFDAEKVFETAKATNTCLEINGQPKRLDLKDSHAKLAKEIGCKFTFGSDAHATSQMEFLKYAVITARRGWIETKDVVNCWDLKKVEKFLR